MNPKLLVKFKNGWENVERIEHTELIKMPIKEKFLKTVSAMKLGFGLGYSIDKDTLSDIQKVSLRWIALKKLLK